MALHFNLVFVVEMEFIPRQKLVLRPEKNKVISMNISLGDISMLPAKIEEESECLLKNTYDGYKIKKIISTSCSQVANYVLFKETYY